jgi:PLP dependent protein
VEAGALRSRIADNFAQVRQSIADAAGGRAVTLVCVTKYAPLEWTAALVEAGGEHIGENLLPAGAEKFDALRAQGLSFTAHMLGPLQSRKARLCAQSCDWYQALERSEIASKLDAELAALDRTLNVLVQVNIGDEDQKHGIELEEVPTFCARLAEFQRLRLRGLMCVPAGPSCFLSPIIYEKQTRLAFDRMAQMFARIAAEYRQQPIDTLSMGMSGDYRWAIAQGATMVRIGRALFDGVE